MTGWEQNADPESFFQAPLDEAAERLAEILREEKADVVTVYDWHGNYGHPDHVKVHTVGHRAADLAAVPKVFEATMNREHIVRLITAAREAGAPIGDDDFDPNGGADDGNPFGMAEAELTLAVDVTGYLQAKRESLRCHRSQITDTSFFLEMPEDAFSHAFGTEWFIEKGVDPGLREGWLFE
jgi:LmbE family N-acetylglucosaminyl deacetylase